MRLIFACLILSLYVQAQPGTFNSTSTGADGALTYAPNLGTVYFPSSTLGMRPNNIYNFTTITIGTGTTVRLSGWVINGPVYWLASGDVNISGTLDLSGQPGYAQYSGGGGTNRATSEPGAGGYSGGLGAAGAGQNASIGNGPGGGAASGSGGGGTYPGNNYLIPLIGGSGGGGSAICSGASSNCAGGATPGGGAGGGVILIASSTQITFSGQINASGGTGGNSNPFFSSMVGGGGSGGAIRLVSNTITVGSCLNVSGGGAGFVPANAGGGGIVRFEAYTTGGAGTSVTCYNANPAIQGRALFSPPHNLALPTGGTSSITVTSVNGTLINANPFSFPDTTVAVSTPVPVVISGVNVPPGTTGMLYIFSETQADQMISFTLAATSTPQQTSATVNVPFPSGGSRGFAKATW